MKELEDEVLGLIEQKSAGHFTFVMGTEDERVHGCFWLEPGQVPSEDQLERMRWAVAQAGELKRLAAAFIRNEVRTRPALYGLLEEDGRPVEWAAPYFEMSEAQYFDDLRLQFVELEGSASHLIRVTYSTELDPEHGVPVLFHDGRPIEAFA